MQVSYARPAILVGVATVLTALIVRPAPPPEINLVYPDLEDERLDHQLKVIQASIAQKERIQTEFRDGRINRREAVARYRSLLESVELSRNYHRTIHPRLSDLAIAEVTFDLHLHCGEQEAVDLPDESLVVMQRPELPPAP